VNRAKTILFLTATRADFGKLKPLIAKVAGCSAFDYRLFVTGMHMLSRYGSTVKEVENAGFKNIFTYINQDGDLNTGMDVALAHTVQGLAHYVREFPADLLVVHGDRIEALAGAIVGALNNTLVAQVEGGEVSGTVDELLRHSISKLAHIHFVANQEARGRLIQMGEIPEAIHVIGSPDIDVMLSPSLPAWREVKAHYEIPFDDYFIFAYHPVTTELPGLKSRINTVVQSLTASGLNFVCLYPNNDAGAGCVLEALDTLRGNPRMRILPSMRFEYFLTLLKNAHAIVGNSSAGIREAPVYGIPTINIGTRQLNRYVYPSIANVPEDTGRILHALKHLPTSILPSTHFGEGNSAELFLEALSQRAFWAISRQKQFRDMDVRPRREHIAVSTI
jgi:UDP-N-acetylglucosamine 2-epimerase (hydrolysing)